MCSSDLVGRKTESEEERERSRKRETVFERIRVSDSEKASHMQGTSSKPRETREPGVAASREDGP